MGRPVCVQRQRRTPQRGVATVLLLLACALQSCAFFSGKPPLPKHASIERLEEPAARTDFAAVVESADVIYFPSDRAASGARSEPAALLVEALEKTGHPFAIAWDLVDASQQPLLDELSALMGKAREELIARLELVGSGRAREHCRALLRELRPAGVSYLALRCPATLIGKIASSEPLTSEEEKLLARGYTAPPGGFQNYAERQPAAALGDRTLARSYRAELVRQQFIAERIVRSLRGAAEAGKLLVFLGDADLGSEGTVPYYVAQKLRVRQLVLGSEMPRKERAKLLTIERGRPAFQIVDRAPVPTRD